MLLIEFSISIAFIILFLYSLFKYKNKIASLFALLCLSIAIFTFGYCMELLSNTRAHIQFSLNIELSGLAFIPALWILISIKFYLKKSSPFFITFIILIIPFLTFFIFLTNQYHHLYYSKLLIEEYDHLFKADLVKGPWYYVFISYTYVGFLFSVFVFFSKWKEASFSFKTQSFWMLIGSFCPAIAYLIYIADYYSIFYDLTTFGFALLALCFFIAIFKYNFLELHKIAREHVFDEINEGIIVLDQNDQIVDYNQAAKNTFSWLNSKAIGKSIFTYPEGTAIGKNASCQFTSEIIRNNQKKYLGFTITNIIQKNEPIGKILIFQDTTEQKDALEKLNYLATNDSLTGIFNRSKLMEEAEKELYKAYLYKKDLSALMIDIDFFKKVNDTYGHLAGDKVITCLANVCKNRLRKSDIIGRYGGEEFLVLLSDTNLQNALQIAEDLRILIEKTDIEYDCKVIKVKVSLGVTSTSIHSEKVRINDLINESDIALYKAKNSGRNRVCSI